MRDGVQYVYVAKEALHWEPGLCVQNKLAASPVRATNYYDIFNTNSSPPSTTPPDPPPPPRHKASFTPTHRLSPEQRHALRITKPCPRVRFTRGLHPVPTQTTRSVRRLPQHERRALRHLYYNAIDRVRFANDTTSKTELDAFSSQVPSATRIVQRRRIFRPPRPAPPTTVLVRAKPRPATLSNEGRQRATPRLARWPPERTERPTSIADSGCSTRGIISTADFHRLGLSRTGPSTTRIIDAKGNSTLAVGTTSIQTNQVSGAASTVQVAPIARSLEGVGAYADDGCVVIFHEKYKGVSVHSVKDVQISWNKPPIRTGYRDPIDRLWKFDLTAPLNPDQLAWLQRASTDTPTIEQAERHLPDSATVYAHNVYELPTIPAGIRYMHAVCGYPAKRTWLRAIRNGHYIGWPLLTVNNVEKHFPESVEVHRGHLNARPAGVRSTK